MNHDNNIKKIKLSDRAKRLEMIGKHIDVRAFEKDGAQVNMQNTGTQNIIFKGVEPD